MPSALTHGGGDLADCRRGIERRDHRGNDVVGAGAPRAATCASASQTAPGFRSRLKRSISPYGRARSRSWKWPLPKQRVVLVRHGVNVDPTSGTRPSRQRVGRLPSPVGTYRGKIPMWTAFPDRRHGLDFIDARADPLFKSIGERFDEIRTAQRIEHFGHAGLEIDDLLGAKPDDMRVLARRAIGLVKRRDLQRLHACQAPATAPGWRRERCC